MKNYTFLSCKKEQTNGVSYIGTNGTLILKMTDRLASIIKQLNNTYTETFPKAPLLRLGLIIKERNGASGFWSVAESPTKGPIFIIEIDPSIIENEEIIAHELAHPIIRLLGVPTGKSVGNIDKSIGNEFTSTSHHPFIFDLLDSAGYADEQRVGYISYAQQELEKLEHADFSSSTYTAPPGQTWLAFWYFNFYLLAREKYNAIYEIHKHKAPDVAQKMDLTIKSWLAATKNKGFLKQSAPVQGIRSFQSHLINSLDLEGRVNQQSLQSWEKWLFNK